MRGFINMNPPRYFCLSFCFRLCEDDWCYSNLRLQYVWSLTLFWGTRYSINIRKLRVPKTISYLSPGKCRKKKTIEINLKVKTPKSFATETLNGYVNHINHIPSWLNSLELVSYGFCIGCVFCQGHKSFLLHWEFF